MRKPDVVFNVNVCPVYHVHGCAEKQAQEARGLFGFHLYNSCPNCKVEFTGWELWGENGHKQGWTPTRARLAHMLKNLVKAQWYTRERKIMGYRFHLGHAIHYVGHYVTYEEVSPCA